MIEVTNLPAFLLAVTGTVAAVLGAIVAYRRVRPDTAKTEAETTKVEVDTAEVLTSMAERLADRADKAAEDARLRSKTLDDRVTAQAQLIGKLQEENAEFRREIARLIEQAKGAHAMEALVAKCNKENIRLTTENTALRDRVIRLEGELSALRGNR